MRQNKCNQGFTLVELLVVIAIIALLAALLQPAVFKALGQGKKVKAQTEIKGIETALKAYLNEYSRFPHRKPDPADDYSYGLKSGSTPADDENKNIMNVLRSIDDVAGNSNFTNNARKIVFMEVNDNSLTSGNYLDPWKKPYEITVDTGFDNNCNNVRGGYGTISNHNVAVWSRGPDMEDNTSDDIRTWK